MSPANNTHFEARLRDSGKYTEEQLSDVLKAVEAEVELAKSDPSFYDTFITGDDIESTYKALGNFIYGGAEDEASDHGVARDMDVTMNKEEPNGVSPPTNGAATESSSVQG